MERSCRVFALGSSVIVTAKGVRGKTKHPGGKEMEKTPDLIRAFAREEDGVTAIGYGLLAGLIALGIIGGATGHRRMV